MSTTHQLPPLAVPPAIHAALLAGADCAWSLSGGVDSQALCIVGPAWFRAQGYPGRQYIIHADLGRAEWKQTPAFVEKLAHEAQLPLVVVQRPKGDLVARIEERLQSVLTEAYHQHHKLVDLWLEAGGVGPVPIPKAKPFWPSSEARYCTSHLKGQPIDSQLRKPAPFFPSSASRYCTAELKRNPIDTGFRASPALLVVSAEGVRGDESRERAKKPVAEIRKQITSKSTVSADRNLAAMQMQDAVDSVQEGQRVGLNWRPLFRWSRADVFHACGTSLEDLERRQELYRAGDWGAAFEGWPCHVAYVMGNKRLSCSMCVLACKSDLLNGANEHPELYAHYVALEIVGGSTFQDGFSLRNLPVTGEAARLRDEVLESFDLL